MYVSKGSTLHSSKTETLSLLHLLANTVLLCLNLCNNIVNIISTAKYLGILIDDQLFFLIHTNFFEKKFFSSPDSLAKFSYHLPFNLLLTFYRTLVHVHLIYALPVWATTFLTYLITLKGLQNKLIRIITKISLSQHYRRLQI